MLTERFLNVLELVEHLLMQVMSRGLRHFNSEQDGGIVL